MAPQCAPLQHRLKDAAHAHVLSEINKTVEPVVPFKQWTMDIPVVLSSAAPLVSPQPRAPSARPPAC